MKKYLLLPLTLLFFFSCKTKPPAQSVEPVIRDSSSTGGRDGDPDMGDISGEGIFYDKFETTLDTSKWNVMQKLWGQNADPAYQHGGVIRENVYTWEGVAVFRSLGDLYTGPLKGVNGRGTRMGGMITSKQRFASGHYEAKIRILQAPDMGVLSAFYLFRYKEITINSDSLAYTKALKAGNIPDKNNVIILNHEIDIEMLGKNLATPYYSNWIGEKEGEFETHIVPSKRLDDNEFHLYRFDWYTGGNGERPRVEYYLDNEPVNTSYNFVPYLAANINVGTWFTWWAGATSGTYHPPAYDKREMWVDWVKFTPFNQPNDDWQQ